MKKKTIMKKGLAMLLVLGMVSGMLTGCGSGGKKAAKTTVFKEEIEAAYVNGEFDARSVTEGVKLTIGIPSNAKVVDYETNNMTVLIEEKLGVDLEFMVLPSADYDSKIGVMVLSGEELPDIIFSAGQYANWIDEGVLVDLTEFYENEDVSANIHAAEARSDKEIIKYMTRPDGRIYALPHMNDEIYAEVASKLWVYQPWLDELGLEVPKTMEEFYEACKLVVENDMNGNGKADEVAVSGVSLERWFDCMMSSFVFAHEENWRVVEDGKISLAYTTDEWKEGLKYIKKFFDEGLIPEETLTQASAQYNTLLYSSTPKVFAFSDFQYSGTDVERRAEYTAIPALEGPDGVKYSAYDFKIPTAGAVITTDCENPLAAFLVCDYMCSLEMSLTQRFGEQGVDWDFWEDAQENFGDAGEFVSTFEGYDIVFYPYDMFNFQLSPNAQNVCYKQTGPMIIDRATASGAGVWVESADDNIRMMAELEIVTSDAASECLKYQPEQVYDFAPLTTEEQDDVADVASAMLTYVKEKTSIFLIGQEDIDKEWKNYLKELENIGMNDYLDILQKAYDRVH